MKKRINENFENEYYNGVMNMSQKEISQMRRMRKIGNYLNNHNGEWFSFYDNMNEPAQWNTAFSDIVYAFNTIDDNFKKGVDTNTKIFVTCSGHADMTNLSKEVCAYLKYMKKQFNHIIIPETFTDADVNKIEAEIKKDHKPSIVFIEMTNHTYDDVIQGNLSEKEVSEIIDDLTSRLLPASGIVVYMEEMSFLDDEEDDEFDSDDREEYSDGVGTAEIEFPED